MVSDSDDYRFIDPISSSCSSVDLRPKVTYLDASPPTMNVVMKHIKCVQLDRDNYYSWEAQFLTMLHGFELMHYVEGNVDLTSSVACLQNHLILRWMLTDISSLILPQVASYRMSTEIQLCLQKLYASRTQTRQLHLCFQL